MRVLFKILSLIGGLFINYKLSIKIEKPFFVIIMDDFYWLIVKHTRFSLKKLLFLDILKPFGTYSFTNQKKLILGLILKIFKNFNFFNVNIIKIKQEWVNYIYSYMYSLMKERMQQSQSEKKGSQGGCPFGY